MHALTFNGTSTPISGSKTITEVTFANFTKEGELKQAMRIAAMAKRLKVARFIRCSCPFSLQPLSNHRITEICFIDAGNDNVLDNLPKRTKILRLGNGFTNKGLEKLKPLTHLVAVHGSSKTITESGLYRLGYSSRFSLTTWRNEVFLLTAN